MEVLFVFILFICVKQNIAIFTNEAISPLPTGRLQMSPTDPMSSSIRYSAKEYNIFPAVSNVLYSISPKAISSKAPPGHPVKIDSPSPSKVPENHFNLPHIVANKHKTAPAIPLPRENIEDFRKNHHDSKGSISGSTQYLKVHGDNSLYTINKDNATNNLKDIPIHPYSKYKPAPGLHDYSSSDVSSYTLPYATKHGNQRERIHNEKNPNMNNVFEETVPAINSDMKPTRAPITQNENKHSLAEVSYPTHPFLRDVNGNYRPETKRETYTLDRARSTYSPVPGTDNPVKPINNQAHNYYPNPNRPLIPMNKNQLHNNPFNTVKDTNNNAEHTRQLFSDHFEPTKPDEYYNLQSKNNIECSPNKPMNNGMGPSYSFIPEIDSQNYKAIDIMEKPIDYTIYHTDSPKIQESKLQNNNGVFATNIQNTPKDERVQQNEQTIMNSDLIGSKGIVDLTNQNIPLEKHKSNNEYNEGYGEMQKHIEKIKQQNVYARNRTPNQSILENRPNYNTIIDKNYNNLPRKIINTSQFPESNIVYDAHNLIFAQNNQNDVDETKEPTMPMQRFPYNIPVLNNQTNYTSDTFQPMKEFQDNLDNNNILVKNSLEQTTTRDYSNTLTCNTPKNTKIDTFLTQNPKNFYDKETTLCQDQYIIPVDKDFLDSFNSRVQRIPQNYDAQSKCMYTLNPVVDIQSSEIDSNLYPYASLNFLENQNYDLIQNHINKEEAYRKQLAKEITSSNLENSFDEIKTIPYKVNSEIARNEIQRNIMEYNLLDNNSYKSDVFSMRSKATHPVNQYETSVNSLNAEREPHHHNIPNLPIFENANSKIKENTLDNFYCNPNSYYVQSITPQNYDNYYTLQDTSEYNNIEILPIASPINILPKPIEPVVIQKPGTYTLSAKSMNDQPRVYTKVQSSHVNADPQLQIFDNTDFNTVGKIQKAHENNLNPRMHCKALGTNYLNANFPTFKNNKSKQCVPNANENYASSPSSAQNTASYSRQGIQRNNPSNDGYTSLISSSLNNMASVLVTNLLSSLSANIFKSINSLGTSINASPNINLPLLPDLPLPSLEVPIFLVIPPCIESPRNLPAPTIATVDEDNTSKTESVSKTNASSTPRNKPSESKPFISSITINVLPSVQQTSNEIIILV